MFKHMVNTPLGSMLAVGEGYRLYGLWFEEQKYFGGELFSGIQNMKWGHEPVFSLLDAWLEAYFMRESTDIKLVPEIEKSEEADGIFHKNSLILSPVGTEFRKKVWNILFYIPIGSILSYNEIACVISRERGGYRLAPQAVGGAVGHNPISILIPCHRVLGSKGQLTGYAGGLDKKEYLLKLEGYLKEKYL